MRRMSRRGREWTRHWPICCGWNRSTVSPAATIGSALTTMEDQRIGSVPVVDAQGNPLGIFTRQDVIGRIVLPQRDLATAVGDVMSAPAITLPAVATAGDAALLMAQRGIRHVIVTDGEGHITGVVSERDLFGLHRLSVREISSALRRAKDAAALQQCAADIRGLSHALVAQGVASGPLTRMISSLNDQLTVRALELAAAAFDLSGIGVCWLGMGSEGRGEQTIATDQDNGIIFAADDPSRSDARHPRAPAAVRPRDQRNAGSLRVSALQGRRHGDESAVVPVVAGMDRGLRAMDRPRRPGQSARGQHILRLPLVVGTRRPGANAARRYRGPGQSQSPLPEADERQRAAQSSAALLARRTEGRRRLRAVRKASTSRCPAACRSPTPHGSSRWPRALSRPARSIACGRQAAGWASPTATSAAGATRSTTCSCCGCARSIGALREDLPPSANPNLLPLSSVSDLDLRILKEALRQVRKLQQRLEVDYP